MYRIEKGKNIKKLKILTLDKYQKICYNIYVGNKKKEELDYD